MVRILSLGLLLTVAALAPAVAIADPADDLAKAATAFQRAKSWHADELLSNGKTVAVDYVAPDRWRIHPTPDITELLIGNDLYMVQKGHTTHLPFGGMVQKTIKGFLVAPADDEIKQSARDLGMQTLNGQSVHVYTFTSHGAPATLYVGADDVPVQNVITDRKGKTTTIKYSNYNAPISIEPQ